jgi:Ca2+-binding RTX toxin-like protein
VSAAGDVNGDGIDDLIVGAPGNNARGAAYVIFGRRDALFTDGDDTRDLNDFDLTLFPGTLATNALAGDDTVTLSETQNLGVAFFGNAGDDRITGTSHTDRVFGGSGRDRLRGEDGRDSLDGGAGSDLLYGGLGNDLARGGNGEDGLFGFRGDDSLDGGAGNDRLGGDGGRDLLDGGDGDDRILAGQGHDRLFGGADDDTLDGGEAGDRMTGGDGDDHFRFASTADSRPGAVDRITDFAPGDLVDLSRIDAVIGGADDAFVLIEGGPFTAPGQLRVLVAGGSTFLQGNTLGSGGTELLIALSGVHAISEADLVL